MVQRRCKHRPANPPAAALRCCSALAVLPCSPLPLAPVQNLIPLFALFTRRHGGRGGARRSPQNGVWHVAGNWHRVDGSESRVASLRDRVNAAMTTPVHMHTSRTTRLVFDASGYAPAELTSSLSACHTATRSRLWPPRTSPRFLAHRDTSPRLFYTVSLCPWVHHPSSGFSPSHLPPDPLP